MAEMDSLRILFVLPSHCTDKNETSKIMLQAYELCCKDVSNVFWIEEKKLEETHVLKTDFIIFDEFKGEYFETVKSSKCARIVGPACVYICLSKGISIPNYPWPIYNVAMMGCVVTCSHLSKAQKLDIKEKVQLMGGCYIDSLMSTTTHLVTESVKSEKYVQAAEAGVHLMVSKWVDEVWIRSQKDLVQCDDELFRTFKCLPFHNLTICSTGFSSVSMRKEVAESVVKNGGSFTGNLNLTKTDVLVVHGESGMESKKYKAARSNPNLFCVNLDWVTDSINRGYALPHSAYVVSQKMTSTPTKQSNTAYLDFSAISAIADTTKQITTFNETVLIQKLSTALFPNTSSPNKRSAIEDIETLVDGLDIKKAKTAGQYLDGCSVYLAGFKSEQREKLAKILNLSGATRYDEISERLTHIIVGDVNCTEIKILQSKNYTISLVSLHWLLDSMESRKINDEETYLIKLPTADKQQLSSPLGRKGLSLLRSNKTVTSQDLEYEQSTAQPSHGEEQCLMQQYVQPTSKDDSDTLAQLLKNNSGFDLKPDSTMDSEQTLNNSNTQHSDIFCAKKFIIVNFSPAEFQNIKEQIESVGGTVISRNYKGIVDYVVTPAFINASCQISALEIVNNFWINHSIEEGDDLVIQYYHRSIVITETHPLENCVVTISGYSGYERLFLKHLIETLGGISQDQFARISSVEKNVLACTHLVSLEPEGKKYSGALKWGVPVVSKEWLLECAKNGKLEDEKPFLMGDSKVSNNTETSLNGVLSSATFNNNDSRGTPLMAKRSMVSLSLNKNKGVDHKILTPVVQCLNESNNENTPKNQKFIQKNVAETPYSQVTPINKLMEEVRKTNLLGTPQTPPMPKNYYNIDTPESPFGSFIRPHLSSKSKKDLMRYINQLPEFIPPKPEPNSTPLSEIKRRAWAKLLGDSTNQNLNAEASPQLSKPVDRQRETPHSNTRYSDDATTQDEDAFISKKIRQIKEIASTCETRRSRTFESTTFGEPGNSGIKDTQPFSVGWDHDEHIPINKKLQHRTFIISGVENEQRQSLVSKIESLGGQVSELASYDPNCTHLICTKPARNEKTLSCMAAGKWILHTSYIDTCVTAGNFVSEDAFEFGNPQAKGHILGSSDKENEYKYNAIHWWRKEILRRGYGAFNDMRAIIVAQKRDPLIRVIEAGGGQIVNVSPPFSENVHATHCLLEVRCVSDFNIYSPLAKQGILCINTLYVSEFLYRTNRDIKDAILPHFSQYY